MVIVILSALVTTYSCKGKKMQNEQSDSTISSKTDEAQPAASSASEPKTYTVTMPDTVVLGTNRDVLIKVKNLKAIELSDPDGKATGIKLSYDLDATNNNKIGGSSITVARLILGWSWITEQNFKGKQFFCQRRSGSNINLNR